MSKAMNQILELGQNADKFHPAAVKQYREFLDEIYEKVPLDTITDDDVKAFLSKSDFEDYQHSIKSLFEWLAKCLLTNDSSALKSYPPLFPVWGVFGFKNLLLKVYQGKLYRQMVADAQNREHLDSRRRDREREEARIEHQQWVNRVNKSLDTLKANLSKNTMPEFQTPVWLKSYHPSVWVKQLSGPTKDWFTAKTSIIVAAYKVTLEKALRDHVYVQFFYWAYHLPAVQYQAVSPPLVSVKGHPLKVKPGVPCLKWLLATYIISVTEFWQAAGNITDRRYGHDFQVQSSPEKLGTVYSGPAFWKYQDAFVTPLSLLALLAWGKAELPGVEVVNRDAPWTVFRVAGFSTEISLHDDFIKFVRDMTKTTSLDKALLDRKMCDKETAGLVKAKLEKLKEPEAHAVVPGTTSEPESTGDPYMDVFSALVGLGYTKGEATKAAKFACEKHPHETLANKIKIALQYPSK
ncbi:MAG: RuvA C-terminal domain-containing protein [Dehalococcoidia bacterium]|nr:RuvA C-terminal domain-containing protein [Dehalococcoidia bacterium]